jgi:hypothetical protein
MTPQEKAKELYSKMVVDFNIDGWQSKQCALIAVNEILLIVYDYFFYDEDEIETKAYWQEVKLQIENL